MDILPVILYHPYDPLSRSYFICPHRICSSPPGEGLGTVQQGWQTFTGTFRGPLLLSTQGMTGGLAGATPRRLDRSPEGTAPSGSWRALGVCPCGDPYCWYELFKEQRGLFRPLGSKLDKNLVHGLQIFILKVCCKATKQVRLSWC